jgi:hypothetical protein
LIIIPYSTYSDDLPPNEAAQVSQLATAIDNQANLSPHGRVWRDEGDILVEEAVNTRYSIPPRLNWGSLLIDNANIKEFDYFRLLFPMKFLSETILPLTNDNLAKYRQTAVTTAEYISFLGITLAMALEPSRGGIESYWRTEESLKGTIYESRNYLERFGMSRDRFKTIRKHFCCARDGNRSILHGSEVDTDPWGMIRPFIDAFNANRARSVTPGGVLTVDEVMSMWLGLDSEYAVEGLPHLTKIARKPRGVGAEMKAMCDGQSGILMSLELMEGKERESIKKYQAEYGHGTAVTMRLVEYWRGSGRIVYCR